MEEKDSDRQEFGERLTQLYTQLKVKRKGFADAIGWEYSRVRAYDEGRAQPPNGFFKRVHKAYPQVDMMWLITGVPMEESLKPSGGEEVLPVMKIPVVDDIPASGFRNGDIEAYAIDHIYITKLNDPTLFALKVKGDSMAPKIEHGDEAVCARSMDFINGKIYAVLVDGKGATLKCVYASGEGFALVPLNPKYDVLPVKADQIVEMYRVVMINKRVD